MRYQLRYIRVHPLGHGFELTGNLHEGAKRAMSRVSHGSKSMQENRSQRVRVSWNDAFLA